MHDRVQARANPTPCSYSGRSLRPARARLPRRRTVDRDLDRRGDPDEAELSGLAGQSLALARKADEPLRLPDLVAPARLSDPPEKRVPGLSVPFECSLASDPR